MQPVILRNRRFVLSRPLVADADAITLACQDSEIAAWVTVPTPYQRSDAVGFLEHVVGPGWASGREATWAVRSVDGPPDEPLLGMIGLQAIEDGSAEIGFWVAPWARNRGVMSQSVRLVLEHAFAPDGLGLVRVTWLAYVGNWASRRVAWRAGFQVEGQIRLHAIQRGVRRDAWVGTILRNDPREPGAPWPVEAPTAPSATR